MKCDENCSIYGEGCRLTLRSVYDDPFSGWDVCRQHEGGIALLLTEYLLQILEQDALNARNNLNMSKINIIRVVNIFITPYSDP